MKHNINNIVFSINNKDLPIILNDNELLYCFNKFKSYFELPIIKINYNNNNDTKYKLNRTFINKYGKNTILNILSRNDKKIIDLETMSSINFCLFIDNIYNIYNCYLYANCFLVVEINVDSNSKLEINKLITNINILIKKIKKYLNIKIIDFIDINYLFEAKSNITSKVNLIKSNQYIKLEVNNPKN